MTRLFGHTRRERTDADTENADLLLRAACVDQLAAGIYTYMPLGLRVKQRVEAIIRQEMDAAGGQEVLMPAIQPMELWDVSGRPDLFGRHAVSRARPARGARWCLLRRTRRR
jgi:prolyl-tRNA synthetase